MSETDPTTDRAQRLQAVERGERATAIEDLARRRPSGEATRSSRTRQQRAKQSVADELDVDREGIGSVERLDGLDVFLRSEGVDQFSDDITSEFASEAEFVTQQDVDPNIDPDAISASPVVAAARRDDVAARARQQLAGDKQFTRPGDLSVDVGKRGVREAGFTEQGRRNRASRQFEAKTPLSAVDPTADLTDSGDGFGLDTAAKRRSAARGFEDEIGVFSQGELQPGEDLRQTDSGFALAEDEFRRVAASRIDEQIGAVDVGPSDITVTKTDSGEFSASFETEVRR